MESFELADPWGQLVSVEGNEEERIPICGDQFTIGRANDTDLVLAGNKYVSSRHCTMQLDEEGVVWLQDTSTNGTLVNGSVVKKDKIKVPHKAIIKLVFRKDSNDTQNVAYQFHDLRSKSSSDNAEFDSDATLDMTLPFDEEDGKDKPVLVGMKRQATEVIEEVTQPKKVAEEKEEKEKTEEGTAVDTTKPALEKKDSIAEALICQICQEILHDCVSLQPCMHSYCGGCYSEWMPYSNRCPTCRKRAQNVSQNHIVRNLVDAYLRTHPEKRRPDDDLKELDDKNRVKKDMCVRVVTEEEEEDDEEGYGSDDDDVSDSSRDSTPEYDNILDLLVPSWPSPTPNHLRIVPHGRGVGFQPITHPPPTLCRECPGFNPAVISSTDSPAASYTCPPSGNHILCQCCFECMPDRRNETDITVPAQKCNVCGQFYCHMYWSCRKIGCTGCLNKFKDMIFPPVVMDQIINNNPYESRILKNYLSAEGSSLQDMFQICLVKLDSGEYHCSDSRSSQASSETIICYKCALKNFRDLAYLYREDIPLERLPIEVTRRSNCYYGNNCRTQQHNPGHAERFNHICSQTKF